MFVSRRFFLLGGSLSTLMLATTITAMAASRAQTSSQPAVLATYDKADGETYFALSLRPALETGSGATHDVVVVFDTSASQTGVYRDDALVALRAMLAGLGQEDRVKLMAGDLQAVPLTRNFVVPSGPEMRAALGKLQRRVPLGSTDMGVVLEQAAAGFDGRAGRPRSLVYVGDGMTKANLLAAKEFRTLVNTLVNNRIAVSAFAIGPHRDVQLLATLANHTGGNWIVDQEGVSAEQAGRALARIADGDVIWPGSIELPATMTDVYPKRVPPLRSDRDTILVGKLEGRGPQEIKMSAKLAGEPVRFHWTALPKRSNDDFFYLPQLVAIAERDDGLTLPTAGSAGLHETWRLFSAAASRLSALSGRALASGDLVGAGRLADAALARDPGDPRAAVVRRAVDRADAAALRTKADDQTNGSRSAPGDVERDGGDFLFDVTAQRRVQTEIIRAEVEDGLAKARDGMDTHARKAQQDLKLLLESVERAPDLEAETRARLRDQIVSAIQEARRREVENDEKQQLSQQAHATGIAHERLIESLRRKDEVMKQIVARFNALMDETRFREAEEAAQGAKAIMPDSVIATLAVHNARQVGFLRHLMELRDVRHKAFVDTMQGVERANVPFADDPPITYSDPEVWEGLTLRRKKYPSMDLAKQNSREEAILEALEEPTTMEFIETPLDAVIDFLKELHEIEIQIDAKALGDVGINSHTPITRNVQGISLRSALRLMLRELDLTYVIQDEVLLITTVEEAGGQIRTRVYPVADLVLPISAGIGANPFEIGAGLGRPGAFGGGMDMMRGGMNPGNNPWGNNAWGNNAWGNNRWGNNGNNRWP